MFPKEVVDYVNPVYYPALKLRGEEYYNRAKYIGIERYLTTSGWSTPGVMSKIQPVCNPKDKKKIAYLKRLIRSNVCPELSRECFKHELDKAFIKGYNEECYKPPRISDPMRVKRLLEVKGLRNPADYYLKKEEDTKGRSIPTALLSGGKKTKYNKYNKTRKNKTRKKN
jgi:hypothetical protein